MMNSVDRVVILAWLVMMLTVILAAETADHMKWKRAVEQRLSADVVCCNERGFGI